MRECINQGTTWTCVEPSMFQAACRDLGNRFRSIPHLRKALRPFITHADGYVHQRLFNALYTV